MAYGLTENYVSVYIYIVLLFWSGFSVKMREFFLKLKICFLYLREVAPFTAETAETGIYGNDWQKANLVIATIDYFLITGHFCRLYYLVAKRTTVACTKKCAAVEILLVCAKLLFRNLGFFPFLIFSEIFFYTVIVYIEN